jgi:hypothetical protein
MGPSGLVANIDAHEIRAIMSTPTTRIQAPSLRLLDPNPRKIAQIGEVEDSSALFRYTRPWSRIARISRCDWTANGAGRNA